MDLPSFLESGLVSDITVVVGYEKEKFRLHKLQLCQHSHYFLRLAKRSQAVERELIELEQEVDRLSSNRQRSRDEIKREDLEREFVRSRDTQDEIGRKTTAFLQGTVELPDLPGGSEAFRVIVGHCYGDEVSAMLTKCNVVAIHCAAVFLKMRSGPCSLLSRTALFMEINMLDSASGSLNVLSHCGPVAGMAEKGGVVAHAISSAINHFEKSHFAVTPLSDWERELVKTVPRLDWFVQLIAGLQLHSNSRSLVCALISTYVTAKQHLFDTCSEFPCSCPSTTSKSAEGNPPLFRRSTEEEADSKEDTPVLMCSCSEARSVLEQTVPLLPSQARLERHFTTSVLISMLRFAWLFELDCLSHLVKLCGRALVQFPTSHLHCLNPSLILQLIEAAQSLARPPCNNTDICRTIDRYLLNATIGLDDFLRLVQISNPQLRESHDDLLQALRQMAARLIQNSSDNGDEGSTLMQDKRRLSEVVGLIDFTKLNEISLMHIADQQQTQLGVLPIDSLLQRAVQALVDIQLQKRPSDSDSHAQSSSQGSPTSVASASNGRLCRPVRRHRKPPTSGSPNPQRETSPTEEVSQKRSGSPSCVKARSLPPTFDHAHPSKAASCQGSNGCHGYASVLPKHDHSGQGTDVLAEHDYGVNLADHSGSDVSAIRPTMREEELLLL